MQKDEFNRGLLSFLDASPTPFHAVSTMTAMLKVAGFEELTESQPWNLRKNGRYYVTRNDSSIIAFKGFKETAVEQGIRLFGAHTDSPCLKIKPQPDIGRKGYLQLGVEVYGGALLNPWFDRDLSLAGRVTCATGNGSVTNLLLDWHKPVAVIPSLAIHLDRQANENRSVNPQTDLPAILMLNDKSSSVSFEKLLLDQIKTQHGEKSDGRLLDYELNLYDHQAASILGMNSEFICSARLDNLLSCYCGLQAIVAGNDDYPVLMVCNDHEEVGSLSAAGADGPFLYATLLRLLGGESPLLLALSKSLMISADNAHALHPNYMDKHDENHSPIVNKGPVIKVNMNQRYATNSVTSGFYRQLSDQAGEPYQVFVVRSDMACGSTIGPITAARTGVKAIDIGVPQWAMHSIRETCGTADAYSLFRVTTEFFGTPLLPE